MWLATPTPPLVEKFKGVLTEQGAEILKVDEWGTRKLAYPVKKQTRGTYVLVAYEAESGSDCRVRAPHADRRCDHEIPDRVS